MLTLEILTKARELLSDPEKWTQKNNAVDEHGKRTLAKDPSAVRWCSLGAILKFTPEIGSRHPALRALAIATKNAPVDPNRPCDNAVIFVNDTKTHADVLAMFDKAIENVKNETPA